MIVFDPRNPRSVSVYQRLNEHSFCQQLPPELIVVIGGDGFMLECVAKYGPNYTFLGLNTGHLGFLLNPIDDWDGVVQALKHDSYRAHSFPLLEAEVVSSTGQVRSELAVNDVYLERSTGQTARLRLSIDGHEVVEALVADGIIFSTALGSTAYSFSAGGAACHPEIPILSVTPICPHLPRLSPFVLPSYSVAEVHVIMPEKRPVRVVCDGRGVEEVRRVLIRTSHQRVKLAYFQPHDFTSTLVRKIVHP